MNSDPAGLAAASQAIEALLTAQNPRRMRELRAALEPGYCLRAARLIHNTEGPVWVCTGFPVANSFETDGPAGALALCDHLQSLNRPIRFIAGSTLVDILADRFPHWPLQSYNADDAAREAETLLAQEQPGLIIVIERPGANVDGRYYNMAGKDISADCAPFEPYLAKANCPVIGIGDGGNEIGMGNLKHVVCHFAIKGAEAGCDELIVADVSNWGTYALIAMSELLTETAPLMNLDSRKILEDLVSLGAVDGVTHRPVPTEDSFDASVGEALMARIKSAISELAT